MKRHILELEPYTSHPTSTSTSTSVSPSRSSPMNVTLRLSFVCSITLLLLLSPLITATSTPASSSTSTSTSTSDAAELQQVKYMVGLLKGTGAASSALFDESASSPGVRVISMTSATGKKFRCSVPDPNFNQTQHAATADADAASASASASAAAHQGEAAASSQSTTTPTATAAATSTANAEEIAAKAKQQQEVEQKVDEAAREKHDQQQVHAIPHRIKTKLSAGCFTKQVDFWTYEVCPFKSVRQYHKEGDKITIEFALGTYIPTGDLIGTAHAPYTQHYSGGASSRQSQVRFLCATDTTTSTTPTPTAGVISGTGTATVGGAQPVQTKPPEHMLTHISEPTPHHYEFEIRTVLACKKPYRPLMKSSSSELPPAHQQVLEILEPLREECLYMTAGWWTYKFCYLKDISQFHRENVPVLPTSGASPNTATPGGAAGAAAGAGSVPAATGTGGVGTASSGAIPTRVVTTAENSLGIIPPTMTAAGLQEITTLHQGPTWQLSYVAQQYTDGAFCDLSKKPRTSEVRFYCDPTESVPALRAVEEIRSCEYILTVRTRLLCQHPAFAPKSSTVQEIVCQLEATNEEKTKDKDNKGKNGATKTTTPATATATATSNDQTHTQPQASVGSGAAP